MRPGNGSCAGHMANFMKGQTALFHVRLCVLRFFKHVNSMFEAWCRIKSTDAGRRASQAREYTRALRRALRTYQRRSR